MSLTHTNITNLTDSGRVKGLIHPVAQEILYQPDFETMRRNELGPISHIDLAHLLMLRECAILKPAVVDPLIDGIRALQRADFVPLRDRPAPRGTYMLYESYLIETLGIDVGGALQTARSRNDLSATAFKMRHRIELIALFQDLLALETALLSQAKRHIETPFPIFTHFQAAQPTTLAQYMLAVVNALQRSHQSFVAQLTHLSTCPLGAGAVTGTSLAIDTSATARALGFEHGPVNAIDAVASRDHALRSVFECTTLGTTISRLTHDLQLWTSQDFGLLEVDDDLVGISSMMPQKRNVYIPENVKGRLATAQGAAQAMAMAMHATPFSNSISVGTEATKHLWPALKDTREAMQLITLIVTGLSPRTDRVAQRLADGYCAATGLADALVQHASLSFRDAHHIVGALICDMQQAKITNFAVGLTQFRPELAYICDNVDLSPEAMIKGQRFGGGPAPNVQSELLRSLRSVKDEMTTTICNYQSVWLKAETSLVKKADALAKNSLRGSESEIAV